jgi:TonB family protein
MNRLTKKCVIGSATLHGSMIGIVLICSAFVGSKTEKTETVIDIVNFGGKFNVTDGPSHGGGTPPPVAKAEPKQAAPPEAVAPPPTPKTPQREEKPDPTPKVEKHVEKAPVQKKQPPKEDPTDVDKTPISKKHVVKVNLNPIVNKTSTKVAKNLAKAQQEQEEADRIAENNARKRANKLAQNFSSAADALARSTAQSVISDSYGDGSGGVASVNYRTLLFTRYYEAWISPNEVEDANATTDARVTIARDGSVVSAVIERRSGSLAMDRSIERTLRTVRNLGKPFPDAWKDSERTFRIRFNLKSKIAIG